MKPPRETLALDAGMTGISMEYGVLSVGFAQDPELEGWQFIISRAVEFDDDADRAGRDDGYDITSGWQEATVPGGVLSWATEGMRITFWMEGDAARELGLAKHLTVRVLDHSTDMEALIAALTDVFGADVSRVTFADAD